MKKKILLSILSILLILSFVTSCENSPQEPVETDWENLVWRNMPTDIKDSELESCYSYLWPRYIDQITDSADFAEGWENTIKINGTLENDLGFEYELMTDGNVIKYIRVRISDNENTLAFNPRAYNWTGEYTVNNRYTKEEIVIAEYKHLYDCLPSIEYISDNLLMDKYILGQERLKSGTFTMYSYNDKYDTFVERFMTVAGESGVYSPRTYINKRSDHSQVFSLELWIRFNNTDNEWRIISFSNDIKGWTYPQYKKYTGILYEYIGSGAFTYFNIQ